MGAGREIVAHGETLSLQALQGLSRNRRRQMNAQTILEAIGAALVATVAAQPICAWLIG